MFTMDEELEKRMKLAEAMTRVEKVENVSLVDMEDDSAAYAAVDSSKWMSSSSLLLIFFCCYSR